MSAAVVQKSIKKVQDEKAQFKPHTVDKEDNLEYDLGNLSAFDMAELNKESLKSKKEEYLYEVSRDNAQLLMNHIFELPSEDIAHEIGRLAVLPKPSTALPREKPVPKPREPTKWEAFAKSKGIVKRKRSRMEFDDQTQEYRPSWGYGRKTQSEQVIIEHKEGSDPTVDPWTQLNQSKKQRIDKNKKQHLQNQVKAATGSRLPGTIDLGGLVDSKAKPHKSAKKASNNAHHHVDVALQVAQKSTASMGTFDKKSYKEPEMKQKSKSVDIAVKIREEKKSHLSMLNRVLGTKDKDTNTKEAVNMDKAVGLYQQSSAKLKNKKQR